MSLDATRGALHEETIYGERLTPRGRAEKLPILSWVDPDFVAPIRSDEFLPLGTLITYQNFFKFFSSLPNGLLLFTNRRATTPNQSDDHVARYMVRGTVAFYAVSF